MRLIMMGTGPFAVPTFRTLYDSRHEWRRWSTAPAADPSRQGGRAAELAAGNRRTSTTRRSSIRKTSTRAESPARLAALRADLLVVCDYGQILAPKTLAAARCGGVNLHASLLPKYRGAAPINWAIYHGETETGVTSST